MANNSTTAAVKSRRRRKTKREGDLISTLPDAILQNILCFLPTECAIKTSLLSKRWRHVWCDTPSLWFNNLTLEADSINQTLALYTALKIIKFHLGTGVHNNAPHIDKWIEFAMSRKVENLSLEFCVNKHAIPDHFYVNSFVKQLSLHMYFVMSPQFVSWTSLTKLALISCILSEESLAKILSGCPVLESLTLKYRLGIKVVDVSKSLRLRTLEVDSILRQIVAPQIHCLILKTSIFPCVLVDVSSLMEAKLDISGSYVETTEAGHLLQVMMLEMLEKVKNVEKLTLGGNVLQVLSLAEIRGLPFPMLKVKALTLETSISRYVIPGVERVLQYSPQLKKLTLHTRHCNAKVGSLDTYLKLQGLIPDTCWRSTDGVLWSKSHWKVNSKLVTSFMELLLKNTKTLEKMVVQLEGNYCKFKELILTFFHTNNVSIVVQPMSGGEL